MKKLIALALALPLTASASVVTVTPTDVNRVFGNQFADQHFSDLFSTYGQQGLPQRTLILTTADTFLAAFEAQLGDASGYTINSAVLTVGSNADPYVSTGNLRSYEVLHAYDHSTVTWNTFDSGGLQGTDYSGSVAATGVVAGNTTSWIFSPDLIQGWINGTTSDYGLYFPDAGAETAAEYTAKANVVWTLDVTATVPEPTSFVLLGMGVCGIGLLRKFRRRR